MKIYNSITLYFLLVASVAGAQPHLNASDSDICAVLNQTIHFDNLQPYYHIELEPERTILHLIIPEGINVECPQLKQFANPVKVMTLNRIGKNTKVLTIKRLEVNASTAYVQFVYPAEGLMGELVLLQSEDTWVISESRLVER